MPIQGVYRGYRAYQAIKRGYKTYNRYNMRYNPIAKFETRLPPGYRKPYRYGIKAGDAILTGGIIYDVAKDIYQNALQKNQQPAPPYKQYKTYRRFSTGNSRRQQARHYHCRRCRQSGGNKY